MEIKIGNTVLFFNVEEYKNQEEWYMWRQYLIFRYPLQLLIENPGYRIPDRTGEEDSFENWKEKGRPLPSFYNYGELVKDEVSDEFVQKIMKK